MALRTALVVLRVAEIVLQVVKAVLRVARVVLPVHPAVLPIGRVVMGAGWGVLPMPAVVLRFGRLAMHRKMRANRPPLGRLQVSAGSSPVREPSGP